MCCEIFFFFRYFSIHWKCKTYYWVLGSGPYSSWSYRLPHPQLSVTLMLNFQLSLYRSRTPLQPIVDSRKKLPWLQDSAAGCLGFSSFVFEVFCPFLLHLFCYIGCCMKWTPGLQGRPPKEASFLCDCGLIRFWMAEALSQALHARCAIWNVVMCSPELLSLPSGCNFLCSFFGSGRANHQKGFYKTSFESLIQNNISLSSWM